MHQKSPAPCANVHRRLVLAAAGCGLLAAPAAMAMGSRPPRAASRDFKVPVLCYHQFGEHAASTMMVSAATLEAQLRLIADGGFSVIPARRLVERWLGLTPVLPDRSCVVTIDDGYRSIYTIFFPLAVKHRIPATIFIYPSAISVLSFALTWEELAEMKASGLIEVQSHSYTHPHLNWEEHRLSGPSFDRFVRRELDLSRQVIEARLGPPCDMLAWPYGLHDLGLEEDARRAGYSAGFGIARRHATQDEDIMALPRYLVTERHRDSAFKRILLGAPS